MSLPEDMQKRMFAALDRFLSKTMPQGWGVPQVRYEKFQPIAIIRLCPGDEPPVEDRWNHRDWHSVDVVVERMEWLAESQEQLLVRSDLAWSAEKMLQYLRHEVHATAGGRQPIPLAIS